MQVLETEIHAGVEATALGEKITVTRVLSDPRLMTPHLSATPRESWLWAVPSMICEIEIHPEDRSRSFVSPANAALKTALFMVEHRGGGNVLQLKRREKCRPWRLRMTRCCGRVDLLDASAKPMGASSGRIAPSVDFAEARRKKAAVG